MSDPVEPFAASDRIIGKAIMLAAMQRLDAPKRLTDEAIQDLDSALCDGGFDVAVRSVADQVSEGVHRRAAEIAETN